jgi:hypothetical protein
MHGKQTMGTSGAMPDLFPEHLLHETKISAFRLASVCIIVEDRVPNKGKKP